MSQTDICGVSWGSWVCQKPKGHDPKSPHHDTRFAAGINPRWWDPTNAPADYEDACKRMREGA